MRKQDYLQGLKDIERVESEVQRDTPAPEPKEPKEPKAAKPEAPAPAAPAPAAAAPAPEPAAAPAPAAAAPAPAPAAAAPAPTPEELFPGFASIAPEIQESIRAKFKLAEEAKAKEEEAARVRREFALSQQRLAPIQQQLSKAQLDAAALAKQVNELRNAQRTASDPGVKAKLDAMRENFPDDAALFEEALQRAAAAEKRAQEIESRFGSLEQRMRIDSELRELSAAHPDWQNKRIGVLADDHGNFTPDAEGRVFRASTNTADAAEMEVWANSLEPYDREIIKNCILSLNARDTIYALNRFEHDRAVAKVLAAQNASGVSSADGSAAPPAAAPALPTPAPDPDPSTRTTAPPRAAGQPVSEKKRALIEAAAFLRQQQEKAAKEAQRRRA